MTDANGRNDAGGIRLWAILIVVFVLAVLFPIAAVLTAYITTADINRILMEFILGTWPNQVYANPSAQDFKTDTVLYAGILLRTFVVFGVPAILGVVVAVLLRRVERRLQGMDVSEYMTHRDTYIRTEIYQGFRGPLSNGEKVEQSKFDERLREVFKSADARWQEAVAEQIKDALNRLELPNAGAEQPA